MNSLFLLAKSSIKYKMISNILVEVICLVLSKDETHLILKGYLRMQKYCNEIIRVSNAICNNRGVCADNGQIKTKIRSGTTSDKSSIICILPT